MKTAKPSTQTATENESCKAMVSFLTLLLDLAAPQIATWGLLAEETMDNRAPAGRDPSAFGIGKFLFVVVLAVILFLLGQSMVRHRFFEGGRFHGNGSIGQ